MPLPIRRPKLPRATRVAVLAGGLVVWACNYGDVRIVEPAPTARGTLTLIIQSDPEDTTVGRELGWAAGIPAAEVTVSPGAGDTATGPPLGVFQTDSTGTVRVPDLPDGLYFVQVLRLLTTAEVARLTPTEDVIGFMTQTIVASGQGRRAATVSMPSSRRHSVVISEWSFFGGAPDFTGYLELANNADTTVYLDGLVIGEGFAVAAEVFPGACATSEGWTNDPDGVWTRYMDSLPGTGHTYPLAPGAVAVIATDGIDHRGNFPWSLDLSHANFEFVGTADADNPSVPNTISIGLAQYRDDHGLYLNELLEEVVFIALPVDVAALPTQILAGTGSRYERVPRARILDVIALLSLFPFTEPLCPHLVNRNFDRYRARIMPDEPDAVWNSIQRKVACTRADGRKILQHTRTSNADLFYGLRTPFQLP